MFTPSPFYQVETGREDKNISVKQMETTNSNHLIYRSVRESNMWYIAEWPVNEFTLERQDISQF